MVQFNTLRLQGFKSFVEATELEIGTGLTGIIGPNGCGKSNLVESLRWVMGESSAKRMRGSGMNDVIFSGTDRRPARNIAEVTLTLDNSKREAPAELNNADSLEIVRRIERDKGSSYKVNGKPVRAKDVQLLFADVSIGANSPALVSQGRVADLINAKPTQRRLILEEAAGISGLHARKHEAGLKLRAAETNLTRVEDVVGQMETQLGSLKKQARQATRYRNISGDIQKTEASLLYLKHLDASTAVDAAHAAFKKAENIVRDLTVAVTKQTTAQTDTVSVLPELRKAEAEAAAALQHVRITYGQLEAEEERLEQETARMTSQLMQIKSDLDRENQLSIEATESIKTLKTERDALHAAPESDNDAFNALGARQEKEQTRVNTLDEKVTALTEGNAARSATRDALTRKVSETTSAIERANDRLSDLKTQKESLLQSSSAQKDIQTHEDTLKAASVTYTKAQEVYTALESKKDLADSAVDDAIETHQDHQETYTKLNAEADAIRSLLNEDASQDYPPVIDSMTVKNGFEKALAAALGDDLQAALSQEAPIYWSQLPALENAPTFPKAVKPLLSLVDAPPALTRCLSLIGIVETSAQAKAFMKDLHPGQCLVTRDGAAFRWDGLSMRDDATLPSAARLEHRNRLHNMQSELEQAAITLKKSEETLERARKARGDVSDQISTARAASKDTERAMNDARSALEKLKNDTSETTENIARLTLEIEAIENTLSTYKEQLATAETDLKSLPSDDKNREKLVLLREELNQARSALLDIQSKLSGLVREREMRQSRLETLDRDITGWNDRKAQSQDRVEDLQTRMSEAETRLKDLNARPQKIVMQKDALRDDITKAEETRNAVADKLAIAETQNREQQSALKEVENGLADAREQRALAQAAVSTSTQIRDTLDAQISEKLDCAAHQLQSKFEFSEADLEKTDLDRLETKLSRLLRERDNMGPVNLRAEVESQEITTQMDMMITEQADLAEAIARLRQGISKLNREARTRLLAAFDTVNTSFGELFAVLFGGGKAYLELTDKDDPLNSGLEIFAQPPGKKCQVLSLFSGGEQTLTSIALIFAMFLTNPAPICVLDEIDAPLDDANVDRVCSLLEKMSGECDTRFIVITHHRMTMSRMDRLYGVTMSERGVSQLVSVDLSRPEFFEDTVAA